MTSTTMSSPRSRRVDRQLVIIFLVSLAGLLVEVGYTRIISYKLWYYYTYLVLGLALLGIGSGGVVVALSKRLRSAATGSIVATCSAISAVVIPVGYLVIAAVPIDTVRIWDYGTKGSFKNLAVLGLISLLLFASFVSLGVMLAVMLGRTRQIGRLYFSDLLGAGLGCLVAIPLISAFGPPAVVMIASLVFAVAAVVAAPTLRSLPAVVGGVATVALTVVVFANSSLPDVRNEATKVDGRKAEYHGWGPVFRVDVHQIFDPDSRLLGHDGTFGSGIRRYDGDPSTLGFFDSDPRSIPFAALGKPSEHTLIVGSAGGHEILASLHYGTKRIEGVELNPVTIGILTDRYKDYTGDLTHQPGVTVHNADARSFLARSNDSYDLVWYVAPDSYAANNAASSGAFVLSESYLYTSNMIRQTLEHLSDDGLMVVQFGELDYEAGPNRTTRYIATARAALAQLGVADPSQHLVLATLLSDKQGDLSTIIVKRTPFTAAEVERVRTKMPSVSDTRLEYAPGVTKGASVPAQVAGASSVEEADRVLASTGRQVDEVTDDAPFFWHFNSFSDVARDLDRPFNRFDPENSIGERVLLLLLAIAVAYAAVFLLLPFFRIRSRWRELPAKGVSGVYFASLGLGFMLLEISLIQKLTLLLGYPTYSLTVTLASILVFTGVGSFLSARLTGSGRGVMARVFGGLVVLVALYQFGLGPITEASLSAPLGARVVIAMAVLAPLGLCLGMFMPLGLGQVGRLVEDGGDYVAWSWAVNGFFSVIGSVLTTILSMIFGFRVVMFMALGVYALATLMFLRLRAAADRAELDGAVSEGAASEGAVLDVTAAHTSSTGTVGTEVADPVLT